MLDEKRDEGIRKLPETIANRYKPTREIGVGPVCTIYEGVDEQDDGLVAIKIDVFYSDEAHSSLLDAEYRTLVDLENTAGIPRAFFYQGATKNHHSVLVLELLGPNLERLRELCGGKFSLKTVCLVAKQMLTRLQSMHEKSYVHCYLMPSSLVLAHPGSDHELKNLIHLVGFGFCQTFTSTRDDEVLSDDAVHPSKEDLQREVSGLSRKDDLESLGLLLAHFLQEGTWPTIVETSDKENTSDKDQNVKPPPELFAGFPAQFNTYMSYVHELPLGETPDYDYLRYLFDQVLTESNEHDDGVYDWMLLNDGKGWNISEGQNQVVKGAQIPSDSFLDHPAVFTSAGFKSLKNVSDIFPPDGAVQGGRPKGTGNTSECRGAGWIKSIWKGRKQKGALDQSRGGPPVPAPKTQRITPTKVSVARGNQRILARQKCTESQNSIHSADLTDDEDYGDDAESVHAPLIDVLCFCLCFSKTPKRKA